MTSPNHDDWKLGTKLRPWRLGRALLRAESPLVMVDLLAFREQATGDFASMSGREAHAEYARSAEASWESAGSKLLWSGQVAAPSPGRPPFEVAALRQYASPRSFLRFALRRDSGSTAREAGLEGQWQIAAQTIDSAPWDVTDRMVLIELVGFGEDGEGWRMARREACTGLDGELIWRGRAIEHVIGAGPRVDEIVITGFADAEARSAGLEALSGVARETGVEMWWTYAAERTEMPPASDP